MAKVFLTAFQEPESFGEYCESNFWMRPHISMIGAVRLSVCLSVNQKRVFFSNHEKTVGKLENNSRGWMAKKHVEIYEILWQTTEYLTRHPVSVSFSLGQSFSRTISLGLQCLNVIRIVAPSSTCSITSQITVLLDVWDNDKDGTDLKNSHEDSNRNTNNPAHRM